MQRIRHLLIDDIPVWSYPAGVMDQLVFVVPSIDSEVIAKVIMPIRIKQRDKPRDRVQPAKNKGLSALLATGSMACYGDGNPKLYIVCGSV